MYKELSYVKMNTTVISHYKYNVKCFKGITTLTILKSNSRRFLVCTYELY